MGAMSGRTEGAPWRANVDSTYLQSKSLLTAMEVPARAGMPVGQRLLYPAGQLPHRRGGIGQFRLRPPLSSSFDVAYNSIQMLPPIFACR
ncbi:hypothetical protein CK218_27140 [Mesorhizobium sp. WSM3879]|nr:hypothetical protein CK218_27140 [Mesorhizobium sp. WSM3879]